MIIKQRLFSFFICVAALPLFAQDKKDLRISFATGVFNSPYYINAKTREFYSIDFEHSLGTRHILATNFTSGRHVYFDDVRSNNAVPLTTPGYENNTNGQADYLFFSFLYKYTFYNGRKFSASAGAGISSFTQKLIYPYTEGNVVDFRESSFTDLAFPVRLDLDYKLSTHIQLGLTGGFYIEPDFPVLGYHVGPRVSYVFR